MYAKVAIPVYWIVNLIHRLVEAVFRPDRRGGATQLLGDRGPLVRREAEPRP